MLTILALGDIHVGSTTGLWPPGGLVSEGGTYLMNKAQQWLYQNWERMLQDWERWPRPRYVVINGDVLQGKQNKDGQLVTNRADLQADAAYELLKPLCESADGLYMLHGTAWHEGRCGEDVTGLAHRLGARKEPATRAPLWWQLYLRHEEVMLRFSHHIGITSVPAYEATVPLRNSYILESQERQFRSLPLLRRLNVWSHRHSCTYTVKPPHLHALVLPGWQLSNEFGYRVSAGALPQIGYARIACTGDEITVKPVCFDLPDPHVEVLT